MWLNLVEVICVAIACRYFYYTGYHKGVNDGMKLVESAFSKRCAEQESFESGLVPKETL